MGRFLYLNVLREFDQTLSLKIFFFLPLILINLNLAHARLMLHPRVLVSDAITAVIIVEKSMQATNLIDVQSVLHSDFPKDPDLAYRQREQKILTRLRIGEVNIARRYSSWFSVEQSFTYSLKRLFLRSTVTC